MHARRRSTPARRMKTLCVEENIIWWERGAARIDVFRFVSVAAVTSLKRKFLKNCHDLSDLWKRSKNRCYSIEEEDVLRSVSAATTSLKNKFLEIAMISLISEKDPRTDAVALKKKMHSDQSKAMFNETTFKSLLYSWNVLELWYMKVGVWGSVNGRMCIFSVIIRCTLCLGKDCICGTKFLLPILLTVLLSSFVICTLG